MKNKLLATLLLGAALLASVSLIHNALAVTTTVTTTPKATVVVLDNVGSNVTSWTLGSFAEVQKVESIVFTFAASVNPTATVDLVRGGLNQRIGTTSTTGTTMTIDLVSPPVYMLPGESLSVDCVVTNDSTVSINLLPVE